MDGCLVSWSLLFLIVATYPTEVDGVRAAIWKRVEAVVRVPRSLRARPPFNQRRSLIIPAGFRIELYARVPDARFLLPLPGGDVLVSRPWEGRVSLVRRRRTQARLFDFAWKMQQPHDMVLHNDNGTDYVYIAESNRVARYEYKKGAKKAGRREIIVDDLPDNNYPGLKGRFMHSLKNIAIKDDILYVSIASATNDDPKDLEGDPKRGAIYTYPANKKGKGELFAEGIRNAEGLAFAPDTDDLWVVVNQRDNVKYPYRDGSGNYGKVVPDFVDDNPPEEFVRVTKDSNFGWPYCIAVPNPSMNNLTFVPDIENNPDNRIKDCRRMTPIDKGIPAHSAPLGLTFWSGTNVPTVFDGVAIVALHGSWNRQVSNGHKVVFFPWKNGRPGQQFDLVSGWLTNARKKERWGRPVDTAVLADGSILISDDWAGALYRLSPVTPGDSHSMHPRRHHPIMGNKL